MIQQLVHEDVIRTLPSELGNVIDQRPGKSQHSVLDQQHDRSGCDRLGDRGHRKYRIDCQRRRIGLVGERTKRLVQRDHAATCRKHDQGRCLAVGDPRGSPLADGVQPIGLQARLFSGTVFQEHDKPPQGIRRGQSPRRSPLSDRAQMALR